MIEEKKILLFVLLFGLLLYLPLPSRGESITGPEMLLHLLGTGEGSEESGYLINDLTFNLDPAEDQPVFSGSTNLGLEIEKDFGRSQSLFLNPELTFDYGSETLEPELKLNEGYIDIYLENADIRVGKQKMTWGKADGLVITNVVNPRDLRAYPMIDFYQEGFKSIYALKLDCYLGMDILEVVWMPEFEHVDERVFEAQLKGLIKSADIPEKTVRTLLQKLSNTDPQRPDSELDDGPLGFDLEETEVAVNYSSMGADVDYEFVAGYLWDDYPTLNIQKTKVGPYLSLKYHRLAVAGGSFSRPWEDFVFRGEALFTHGKRFNRDIFEYPRLAESAVGKNKFEWMFGAEYGPDYLVDQINLQVNQEVILDYDDSIITDQYSTQATLTTQGMYMRNKLSLQASLRYDLNWNSLRSRIQLTYGQSGNIEYTAGLDYNLEEGEGPAAELAKNAVYVRANFFF